jgi:hypothetical protein
MLQLLETNAPALAVQRKDADNLLGYVTLTSINHAITRVRGSQNAPEETHI